MMEGRDEEEGDYMSEEMLQSIREAEQMSQPRQLTRKRRQVQNPVSVKKLMQENMDKAQDAPIDQSRFGFKLMAKMGYQEGSGLGKHGQGIVDALKVAPKEIKQSGIGIEENIKRKRDKVRAYIDESNSHREQTRAILEEQFPDVIKQRLRQRSMLTNIPKAKRVIMDLDTRAGKEPHDLWPEDEQQPQRELELGDSEFANVVQETEEEQAAVNEPYEPEQNLVVELEKCVTYLRQEYFYCMFCGTKYDSEADLHEHCPGPSEEDHEDL